MFLWMCQPLANDVALLIFLLQFSLGNLLVMHKSRAKCKPFPSTCLVSHWDTLNFFRQQYPLAMSPSSHWLLFDGTFLYWKRQWIFSPSVFSQLLASYIVTYIQALCHLPCLPSIISFLGWTVCLFSGLATCLCPCPCAGSATVGTTGWEHQLGTVWSTSLTVCYLQKEHISLSALHPQMFPGAPTTLLCSALALTEPPESPKTISARRMNSFLLGECVDGACGTIQQSRGAGLGCAGKWWEAGYCGISSCWHRAVQSIQPCCEMSLQHFLFGRFNPGSSWRWTKACSGRRWACEELEGRQKATRTGLTPVTVFSQTHNNC